FEEIYKIEKKELIFKDENNHVIRRCRVFAYDTYYDYDKKGDLDYPPKFEWDNDSMIWDYSEGRNNRDSFSIISNDIRILGKKVSPYGSLEVHVVEGEIKIRASNNFKDSPRPVGCMYMSDVEEVLERFLKRIGKMDIDDRLKALLIRLVSEAKIVKEERK
ncbi:hypothetical protein QUF55_10085, partial [Clostridiaceae bacterium HSG29]|nr:hypothetical protein [Clostridiaceae bacterium HSG29]